VHLNECKGSRIPAKNILNIDHISCATGPKACSKFAFEQDVY